MEGYFSDDDGHGPLASSSGSHRETSIVLHAGHNNPTQSPSNKSCWLAKIQEHLMLIHGTDKVTRDDMAALQHLPDSTVGIMYSLFKQFRTHQEENLSLSFQVKSARSEVERLLQERRGWEERVKVAEEDRLAADNRVSCLQGEHREEKKRWHDEREQLLKQIVSLRHKDSQYNARVRKAEDDYRKLQSRLRDGKGSVRSLDITPKPLQETGGLSGRQQQATPRGTAGRSLIEEPGDEVTQVMLPGLQRRVEVLLQENADLKGMLREMLETVTPLSRQVDSLEDEQQQRRRRRAAQDQQCGGSRLPPLEAGAFGMPLDWLAAKVGEPLRQELEELQRRVGALVARAEGRQGEEEGLEELRSRLTETEDVLLQQDRVIRAALFGGDGSGVMGGQDGPPTSDSWLEDERECLDEERELLRKQRLRMDREQRVLDNIADKLGRVMPIDWRSERQQLFGAGDALLTPSPKAGKQHQQQHLAKRASNAGGLSGRLSGLLLSPLLQPSAILAATTTPKAERRNSCGGRGGGRQDPTHTGSSTGSSSSDADGQDDGLGLELAFSPIGPGHHQLSPMYLAPTSSSARPATSE